TRHIKRLIRRIFNLVPEWLRGLGELLEEPFQHVMLFRAIPTIVAMLLVPRHFFRHVDENGKGTIPLKASPMKLVLQTYGLVGVCLWMSGQTFDRETVSTALAVISITSPLWMFAFVGMIGAIGILRREFKGPVPLFIRIPAAAFRLALPDEACTN